MSQRLYSQITGHAAGANFVHQKLRTSLAGKGYRLALSFVQKLGKLSSIERLATAAL